MHQPQQHHWKTVRRILRYLSTTVHYGLCLRRCSQLKLQPFVDAD